MISQTFKRIFKREPIYYGWVIALALAVTETVSYGVIFYAFSVFITPMEAELGWSRAQLTGAFSLSLLITGLVGVPVGYWLDKRGGRLLMTAGSIGATILVALWSQVQTLPEFVLIMTLLGFCAAAVLYEPAFAVIATWFARRRGTAMALLTFVAGFASTIFIPLSDALLVAQGWRGAVLTLAILLGAITIPLHCLLLRGKPADLGLLPDGAAEEPKSFAPPKIDLRGVLRSRYFWILTLAFALSTLSMTAVRVHFIPLLISVGIHPSSAAWAAGAIGVMQVVGRMIFAPVERNVSSKTMVIGVLGLSTLSMATLFLGSATWTIALFVALFGMAFGTLTLARPLIVADSYGAAYFGRISAAIVIVQTLMGTSAPVAAGLMYDVFGNYDAMLAVGLVLCLLSVGLIWVLPKRQSH